MAVKNSFSQCKEAKELAEFWGSWASHFAKNTYSASAGLFAKQDAELAAMYAKIYLHLKKQGFDK
jgi:hypothetical protein